MIALAHSIPESDIDYAKTLKLHGWSITWEMFVRGQLHNILDIVRQNAAIGWTILTMVEGLVRSQGGIGALMLTQDKFAQISGIVAIQLTILSYGIIQDYALRWLTKLACPYANTKR